MARAGPWSPHESRKLSLTLFWFRAHLPPLPSGEGAACAPGRDAEGRRSRGGRSVCVRLGRPPRLQGVRARRKPPPGHYEPGAPIGRLGTPKVTSRGVTPKGSRRAVVEATEKRPVRGGRGERTAGTPQAGRPKSFRRPPPRLFTRPESAPGMRPGW